MHKKTQPIVGTPARARRGVPGTDFLHEVQGRFGVALPEPFVDFCRRYAGGDVVVAFPGLRRGAFIVDFPTFEAINGQVGTEEWGDYERILVGTERPKSGARLWGGIVPFYYDEPKNKRRRNAPIAESIYGFSSDEPKSIQVLVWSVHTIVHRYESFDAWLDERRR